MLSEAGGGWSGPCGSYQEKAPATASYTDHCEGVLRERSHCTAMSARRRRYEEEGEFCIPGLGDRNYRPGE